MGKIKKILLMAILMLMFIALVPGSCWASVSGTKTDNVTVKLYFKRSPEWKKYVKTLTKDTNSDGVLKAENVLEGWYKPVIVDEDTEAGQYLAVKLRMLNVDGQYVKNTKVKMYIKIGDSKIYVKTVDSDERGWIESEGLTSGSEYYLEVDNDKDEIAKFSQKLNQPRIKAKVKKVGKNKKGENWIQGLYTRTDKNQTLDVGKIQEGFYKFFLKKGDVLPKGFFNVQAQILRSNTKKIQKPTMLKLYAYPQDKKTFLGEVKTSQHGEIFLPKMIPNIKYRVVVAE